MQGILNIQVAMDTSNIDDWVSYFVDSKNWAQISNIYINGDLRSPNLAMIKIVGDLTRDTLTFDNPEFRPIWSNLDEKFYPQDSLHGNFFC